MAGNVKIENRFYRVEIDRKSGAVKGLFDKNAGLELISEPRLAESFRLLLPLPALEANYILGKEQKVSRVKKTEGGAILEWDGPLANAQGRFNVSVAVEIELADDMVQFRIALDNKTEYKIAEVWHAALGGMMGLGNRKDTRTLIPQWSGAAYDNLFQDFPEATIGCGTGMRFPGLSLIYPSGLSMPWVDIYNPKLGRGIYYACHDVVPRVNILRFEMHPGLARRRSSGNWPTDEEIAPMKDIYPAGMILSCVHMPFTPPGRRFESPTVAVQCHAGDWHAGAKIYRNWFVSHFPLRRAEESWLRREQAVYDCLFLMPEGNFTLTFKDIPRLARDAADYGVKAFLASGWMVGGHDNQYPRYEPDPRLGTWKDLADAINACHAMGVKIHFFSNIQSVDTSTQWYQKELHQYRVMSAKGEIPTEHYGMGTLSARLGCTAPPLSLCDPAFPQYRGIIVDYMRKLARIGADGVHYDKVHGGWMDFNPNLPLGPDQAHPSGIIKCLEETLTECRKFSPDFCLGVESHWDRLLSYCDAWWLWHDDDHVAVLKYAFPEFLSTFQVNQPWDYANVNRAVQYGYQLLIGPVRWTGSMKDEQSQPISNYIKETIRIREELKETIFFGEFLDDQQVAVEARPGLKYGVHRNPRTGQRACVLVNHNMKSVRTRVKFEGNRQGRVFVYQPFINRKKGKLPLILTIRAERFVIVAEE